MFGFPAISNINAYQTLCTGSFPEMMQQSVDQYMEKRLKHFFVEDVRRLQYVAGNCLKASAMQRCTAGQARGDVAQEIARLEIETARV